MENYLSRTGVSMSMLDQLSVIHVAGTKGKGSTSAMCESILRRHGFRTGFYSSPHLVAVRERIQLSGTMLSERQFAEHFHRVYDSLYSTQAYNGDMPKYFAFLTVLAYNVFLKEKVDVAIVEVGIGGSVDYTNVVRKVPIVGITSLGLDHTSILGTTLPEIAAAKAGIMKPRCAAYTVQQPPDAMKVLRTVAAEIPCPLTVAPDFNAYKFSNGIKVLPIDLEAYRTNASLAIQLAHAWMRHIKRSNDNTMTNGNEVSNGIIEKANRDNECNIVTTLPPETVQGLKECRWPGRFQVIKTENVHFYLDGAHTKESMEICAKWFEENNRGRDKVLVFSATGDRDVEILLRPLRSIKYKKIFFVIPTAHADVNKNQDNYSSVEQKDLIAKCNNNANIWKNYQNSDDTKIDVLECVSDALCSIKDESGISVLMTGSLHLVGAALSIINPKLH
ncbi:folylpolyglutamate synthase, mitochondrial isoform X2 [Epargyreus clarus]